MVLPVVGMGGLGKTTLAQLVYNDPKVKEYFNLQLWICVSDEFNIGRLVKSIIELVNGECNLPIDNMELLQRHLREILSGKRYVLVLDDVWNDNVNEWERLRALINCGDSGSVVIVTTRNNRVAQIMGTMESYNLECLGEEDSWSLFQNRAFSKGVKEHLELVEIGKKLVQNCGGLSLAIKALSSLMSYKHEVCEWLAVLEQSTIWGNNHVNDEVLPVLRLSYDYLPSYMKQCFAFCAVFPKDYVMEKEKLVQLWMAHGFIPSDGAGDLEMTGNNIFNELAWRSFFQNIKQDFCDPYRRGHGYRSQTTCKMHDLMHDLAQLMMRDECLSLHETSQINDKPQCKVRHIFLGFFSNKINDVFESFPATRSLISFRDGCSMQRGGILKSNFLRVLDLFIMYFDKGMLTFPRGNLKHLRFLNLSQTMAITLPEAITTLYLLQTLRLKAPSKLPEGMRYMRSLRHLYIETCSELECMPPGLGELKYLQTLTCYIVGIGIGNGIGELRTLNLGGQLQVYNLREVRDARDAREANLISKQNLDHLVLCWGMPINDQYELFSDYSEDQNEYSDYSEVESYNGSEVVDVDPFEVLDALKPCNKLKVLRLEEYNGDKFPVWMTEYQMLENLVELYIIECTRCTNGLPLHRLPLLQILQLKFMDNLRHLCCGVFMSAKGGEDAPITFPSLKILILSEMPNLQFWCEGDVSEKTSLIFPVLSEMSVIDCPKLSAMPVTPLLERMTIIGNKILSCFATGLTTPYILTLDSSGGGENKGENNADETLSFKPWESPSLKPWVSLLDLTIKGFNHIIPPMDRRECEKLSVDVNATALQDLCLQDLCITSSNFWFSSIPSNSPLWLWKCFTYLKLLRVEDCDSLIYWPEEELSNLNYLEEMYVVSCRNFLGSCSEPLSEKSARQVLLPKLKYLDFLECPNMIEVPKLSKSLEELNIKDCTKLESLPEWLDSLVALTNLGIDSCESLNSLPSSIECLIALKVLYINGCPNMVEIPKLPISLEILEIGCKKLKNLPEWFGSLVALKRLEINSCESLNAFPSSIKCLIALESLWIDGCINLESLPEGMQGLEALKTLAIIGCSKIRILPEDLLQRLRSLNCLAIRGCPLLQRDFQKHGKYWHLISEIPDLRIGEECRSSKMEYLTRLISSRKIPCLSVQS